MNMFQLFANLTVDSRWLDRGFIVPIVVGAVAGLGAVAAIHVASRRRNAAAMPSAPLAPKPLQPAEPCKTGDYHDPFDHGATSEQRKAFRRKGNPVEVMVIDKAAETRQIKAH